MLPETIAYTEPIFHQPARLCWRTGKEFGLRIFDTELLHLCWLAEETLDNQISDIRSLYLDYLGCEVGWKSASKPAEAQFECTYNSVRATWQQRVIALAKVKGIEI